MGHQRRYDVCDSGDHVGQDLIDLEKLDDAVPVAVKDAEEGRDDALDPLNDGLRLVNWIKKLDKHGDAHHGLVLADESVAIRI